MSRTSQATVTTKGQVTLPRDVRVLLRIGTGDRILFVVGEDGAVQLCKVEARKLDDLVGILGRSPHRMTVARMNDSLRKAARQRARRR